MNKYEQELFGYCIDDDFNPDGVQVTIMDAYDKGFGRGFLISSTCIVAFAGFFLVGLYARASHKRKKHGLM